MAVALVARSVKAAWLANAMKYNRARRPANYGVMVISVRASKAFHEAWWLHRGEEVGMGHCVAVGWPGASDDYEGMYFGRY